LVAAAHNPLPDIEGQIRKLKGTAAEGASIPGAGVEKMPVEEQDGTGWRAYSNLSRMVERRVRDLFVWQLCIPMGTRNHTRCAIFMCKLVKQADSGRHIKHLSMTWSTPVYVEALLPESW